jgi:hypothetical protein
VAPTPSPSIDAADVTAIHTVFEEFENAFVNKSSGALQRLWPSLANSGSKVFDNAFAVNSEYRVEILDRRIARLSPTRARVACKILRVLTPKQGTSHQETNPVTFVLDKTDDGWLISDVQGWMIGGPTAK